jgi:adenylate cyclase
MSDGRVERRLAAILAADVAGYSRLIGEDEEGTLARLRALRRDKIDPKIAEHRGRIVKTTGDGLLVEFASVVDALRCAAAWQAAVPAESDIAWRIGVHQGDIVADDGDIFGDGVNVAARLEALAEPGGICISARVQEDAVGRLDLAFEDIGEQKLKNIARPVRAYRVRAATHVAAPATPVLALPDKPSIAVLPFQNMSGDPEQEYFADGMVEDIITGLSRIKWLFVIARNSTFVYKNRPVDVKQVGQDLGVRYVLEGSVRKAGNRVRITGQLIDSATGAHLWAERYDRSLDDIFDLQDEMTLAVVGAIEPSLRQAEIQRARRKRTDSLNAYDFVLRAADAFIGMPEPAARALPLLHQAVTLDPTYAIAHGVIALCHHALYMRAGLGDADKRSALHHARIAIAEGGDDTTALALGAFVIGSEAGDYDTAFNALDRALALSPSSFLALAYGSMIRGWGGDYKTAIEYGERAIRLSPFDTQLHLPYNGLAYAHYFAGNYEEAARAAARSAQAKNGFSPPWVIRTAALAQLGRDGDAWEAANRLLELWPGLTVKGAMAINYTSLEHLLMVAEGLRKAGIPED